MQVYDCPATTDSLQHFKEYCAGKTPDYIQVLVLRARPYYEKSEKGSGVWSDFRLSPGQIYDLPMKLQESGHMTLWWLLIGIISHVTEYC